MKKCQKHHCQTSSTGLVEHLFMQNGEYFKRWHWAQHGHKWVHMDSSTTWHGSILGPGPIWSTWTQGSDGPKHMIVRLKNVIMRSKNMIVDKKTLKSSKVHRKGGLYTYPMWIKKKIEPDSINTGMTQEDERWEKVKAGIVEKDEGPWSPFHRQA